jgi:hypothetical protein
MGRGEVWGGRRVCLNGQAADPKTGGPRYPASNAIRPGENVDSRLRGNDVLPDKLRE